MERGDLILSKKLFAPATPPFVEILASFGFSPYCAGICFGLSIDILRLAPEQYALFK